MRTPVLPRGANVGPLSAALMRHLRSHCVGLLSTRSTGSRVGLGMGDRNPPGFSLVRPRGHQSLDFAQAKIEAAATTATAPAIGLQLYHLGCKPSRASRRVLRIEFVKGPNVFEIRTQRIWLCHDLSKPEAGFAQWRIWSCLSWRSLQRSYLALWWEADWRFSSDLVADS